MQAVFTPAVHVELAAHVAHGATPGADQVEPATHAMWHTLFAVLMQAVFTPAAHVESAVHVAHGA